MGGSGNSWKHASKTSYEIAFTYKGIRCRERIKLKPSTSNDRRISNHLGAILDAIDKDTFDYSVTFPDSKLRLHFIEKQGDALLLENYLDEWLEAKVKRIAASTLQGYTKIINNLIIPKFKGQMLSMLKRSEIRKWLADMDCSNKRLSNIQSVFRTALQDAVDDEIIDTNPLYGWKYENREAPKTEDDVDPFNSEEQQLILGELTGQNRNLYQCFFWSGLRPSEMVALQWSDIDWLRGEIDVNKALTQASEEFEETKTRAGKRRVKILAPVMEALIDQKQYTYLQNKEIFQNPITNEAWTGDASLRKTVWAPALRRAKVKYRRPYQTRHTYASMMLTAGESIAWLADQMGHADWASLRKTYAKFIKNAIPDAGEKAVQMFNKNVVKNVVISTPIHPKKLA
jgi:integrase